ESRDYKLGLQFQLAKRDCNLGAHFGVVQSIDQGWNDAGCVRGQEADGIQSAEPKSVGIGGVRHDADYYRHAVCLDVRERRDCVVRVGVGAVAFVVSVQPLGECVSLVGGSAILMPQEHDSQQQHHGGCDDQEGPASPFHDVDNVSQLREAATK